MATKSITNNKDFVLSDNFESTSDPIRQNIDSFWIKSGEQLSLDPNVPLKLSITYPGHPPKAPPPWHRGGNKANIEIENPSSTKPPTTYEPFVFFIGTDITENILIPIYSETIKITPNQKIPTINVYPFSQTPESVFRDYVEQLTEGDNDINTIALGPYADYQVELDSPVMYVSNINNRSRIKGDVEYAFNYGNEIYETSIAPDSVSESKLLNFYKYFGDKEERTTRSSYTTYVDGKGSAATTEIYEITTTPDPLKASKANAISTLRTNLIPFSNNIKDFFITKENFVESAALSENKELFPFFNQISFSNPPESAEEDSLKNTIYDSGLATAFCDCMNYNIVSFEEQTAHIPDLIEDSTFTNYFLSSSYLDTEQTDFVENYEIQSVDLKMIDALQLLREMHDALFGVSSDDTEKGIYKSFSEEASFTKDKISTILTTETTKIKYANALEEIRNQYQDLLINKNRTYKDILLGVKPYTSEVLFYRIAKYRAGATRFPIQNFWIPASNAFELNYIDSQVKYGKRYHYKIYAYKMMVGSEYDYSGGSTYLLSEIYLSEEIYDDSLSIRDEYEEAVGDISETKSLLQELNSKINYRLPEEYTYPTFPTIGNFAYTSTFDIDTLILEIRTALLGLGLAKIQAARYGDIAVFASFFSDIINSGEGTLVHGRGFGEEVTVKRTELSPNQYSNIYFFLKNWEEAGLRLSDLIEKKRGIINLGADIENPTDDTPDKVRREVVQYLNALNWFVFVFQDAFLAQLPIPLSAKGDIPQEIELKAKIKPSLKLIEIPYYESVGTIVDNPPLFPNINFVTYKGIDNRISFFMNSGQGSLEQEAIVFSEAEEEFYRTFREARKLNDFQEILYRSDEFENLGTSFEIRRLSTPPKSYDDFKEAVVQKVSKMIATGEILPAATFTDKITPNKKYYYMFRVFDRRFNVSNPTAVYEIELVENSGAIYPLINSYDFLKKDKKTNKGFKRLFNIIPRLSQVLPTNLNAETYGDLSTGPTSILGTEDEALFGKTFKIRLSSKKTGKVIDLNVNFNSVISSTE